MEKYKEEVDELKEKAIYDYADRFINLANEICKSDNSGAVGVALRFAAARYCAFEASLQTQDLVKDKDKYLEFYTKVFKEMLQKNLNDYIMLQYRK